jgi:chitinase
VKRHFRGNSLTVVLTLLVASLTSAWQCQEKPKEVPAASGRAEENGRAGATDRVCGNAMCEIGETAASCGADCAGSSDAVGVNSVHVYLGWGNPPDLVAVMSETGLKQFSLSFIFSDGGCNPKWDGAGALTGGIDWAAIDAVRAHGGDVVVTFGGSQGPFLEDACKSPAALAGAYQAVIDAYALKAIDIDVESPTFYRSAAHRARVVDALKIVQANNPSLKIYVTSGTVPTGPGEAMTDLIQKAASAGLNVTAWTGMPFDFESGYTGTMAQATISASDGLQAVVAAAYGYDVLTAYNHIGISSMNGRTEVAGETVSIEDWNAILSYAQNHHVGRLSFWSLNRDRSCDKVNKDPSSCSGITQSPFDFTKILAAYPG